MKDQHEGETREILAQTVETGALSILTRSEIDQQIATAHKFPRSLKRFRDEALQMVTLNERIAEECIYSLPRDGKVISGPSARFAEIIASAWGNCRAGARVVNESAEFITAQGVFHDLERNVAIAYEVQRRITNSKGKRYGADMVGVTGNAASSIALRNAILKGVPKAFWSAMYDAARATVMGNFETLGNRRAEAFKQAQAYGINKEQVCAILRVAGQEDIGLEQMVVLKGFLNAIQEGDTTVEQLLADAGAETTSGIKRPERKAAPEKTQETAPEQQPDPREPGDDRDQTDEAIQLGPNAESRAQRQEEKPAKAKNATKSTLPENDGTVASQGMQKQVAKALERAGKDVSDIEEEYGIPLQKFPASWVNHALVWLR